MVQRHYVQAAVRGLCALVFVGSCGKTSTDRIELDAADTSGAEFAGSGGAQSQGGRASSAVDGNAGAVARGGNAAAGGSPSGAGAVPPSEEAGATGHAGGAEGGTTGSPFGGAGSAGRDGGAGSGGRGGAGSNAGNGGACTQHCKIPMYPGSFCAPGTVTWLCDGVVDNTFFSASCQVAPTGAIRFCCPPEFHGECP